MISRTHPGKSAFTLVELSIVLVIIGLLVGGVLAGQSLIRAAQLRSIATQFQRYTTAVGAFQDKFHGLPGDIKNATTMWGVAAAGAACLTTAGTGTQTCDGNGDGMVIPSTNSNESYRFWQHLANAGLIEGSYDGIQHGTTSYSSTAANSPAGRITNTLWFAWNWGVSGGGAGDIYALQYDNFLEYGTMLTNGDPTGVALKPEEAWNIDIKLDDGMPATGSVIARNYGTCTNSASVSDTSGTYTMSNSAIACSLVFRQAF